MKEVRIIKPYDLAIGKLVQTGVHEVNDRIPLVKFINDKNGREEPPYILYGHDHDNYFLETPENLEKLEILKDIDAQIEELKGSMKFLIGTMTDSIYNESFFKHAMTVVDKQ